MSKDFNEVLKQRELNETKKDDSMSLDSTERIKVLSPGQLVFKRFITNKLAIVGSLILIFMFTFAFLCPFIYPYGQTQIFYKYDNSLIDYAQVKTRTEFTEYDVENAPEIHYTVKNMLTADINQMKSSGLNEMFLSDNAGNTYKLLKNEDNIYSLYKSTVEPVASLSGAVKYATFSIVGSKLEIAAGAEEVNGFENALKKAIDSKADSFKVGGKNFSLTKVKKNYDVYMESDGFSYVSGSSDPAFEEQVLNNAPGTFEYNNSKYSVSKEGDVINVFKVAGEERIAVLTTYVFNAYDEAFTIGDDFKFNALIASVDNTSFSASGKEYIIRTEEGEKLVFEKSADDTPVASFSTLVIRRYNGEDSLGFEFKEKAREVIDGMTSEGKKTAQFTWPIAQVDKDGAYTYDENGELIKEDRTVTVTDKNGSYVLTVEQVVYLINTFERPGKEHWAGTDGDGMDVLARMMYGGRVSLMVAFVVVILETILGIILGGIAGYFGGWIDNIIMRMVDVFYCIPTLPILIILGSLFDSLKLKPYVRLTWLMAVLGILGWASIARMVRGQILSLREQEFMVAAEAIGLKSRRRIFKHLIPNVMPQLIVTATSGLGAVIIYESTLSFLGLGVKHPLATWGTMINSVSTAEAMKAYTYIWVPVGLLICLTVIAFNFVGDGLRDAFDPKMKR